MRTRERVVAKVGVSQRFTHQLLFLIAELSRKKKDKTKYIALSRNDIPTLPIVKSIEERESDERWGRSSHTALWY